MDQFSQAVTDWHDFYITIATVSATLVGLLFVAVSLHTDFLADDSNVSALVVAWEAFSNFIYVLFVALIFLVPHLTPFGLGAILTVLGLAELIITARLAVTAWRSRNTPDLALDLSYRVGRILLPLIGYVILIGVGLTVLAGRTEGLTWLVPVMILLLLGAASSAWTLLLRLAAIKLRRAG